MDSQTSSLPSPLAVSPWLTALHTHFTEHESRELRRFKERTAFSYQFHADTARENLLFMLNASLKEHDKICRNAPTYSPVTRELVIRFIHEACDLIFEVEDSLTQRVIILFDHCLFGLN